jgi:hypothetical protein
MIILNPDAHTLSAPPGWAAKNPELMLQADNDGSAPLFFQRPTHRGA